MCKYKQTLWKTAKPESATIFEDNHQEALYYSLLVLNRRLWKCLNLCYYGYVCANNSIWLPFPVELLSVEIDKIFENLSDPKMNTSFTNKDLSWHFGSTCYDNKLLQGGERNLRPVVFNWEWFWQYLETFFIITLVGHAISIWWVEAWDAAESLTMHRIAPTMKVYRPSVSTLPSLRNPELNCEDTS